jgi:hypothetical protein
MVVFITFMLIIFFVNLNKIWFIQRKLVVFGTGVLTVAILSLLALNINNFIESYIKSQALGVLLTSALMAFVIWSYRDKNTHETIENARFDTNLKYFDQIQNRLKTILPIAKKEGLNEFFNPNDIQHIDRQDANATSDDKTSLSLTIAAILQLGDFIQGRYGENLRRPAFHLLRSLWESYVAPSYLELMSQESYDESDFKPNTNEVKNCQAYYQYLQKDKIVQTLSLALLKGLTDKDLPPFAPKVASFKGFENDLQGLFLVGLNTYLMPETILTFDGVILNKEVKLDFAHLHKVKFINTELNEIAIRYSTLYEVLFTHNTKLNSVSFQHSYLFNIVFYCTEINNMQINLIRHYFCIDDAYKNYIGKSKEMESKLTHLIQNNKITFNHSEINTLYSVREDGGNHLDFVFQNSSLSKTRFQTGRDCNEFPTIKLEGKVTFNQCAWFDSISNYLVLDNTKAKQIQMESCLFIANPNDEEFDTTKVKFIKSYYFNDFEKYIIARVKEDELSEESEVFQETVDWVLNCYLDEPELQLNSLLKEGHITQLINHKTS